MAKPHATKDRPAARLAEDELRPMAWRLGDRMRDFDPDAVIIQVRGGGEIALGDYLRARRRGSVEGFHARMMGLDDPDRPARRTEFDADLWTVLAHGGGEVPLGEYLRAPHRGTIESYYSEVVCGEDPEDVEVRIVGKHGEGEWVPLSEMKARRRNQGGVRVEEFDADSVIVLAHGGGEVVLGEYLRARGRGTIEQYYAEISAVDDPMDNEVAPGPAGSASAAVSERLRPPDPRKSP